MPTALVTGASAGLGTWFARLAAADRYDLVLVARRRDRLEALGAELAKAHGIKTHVVAADLGAPGGFQSVVDEVSRAGISVDVLVNNAGFGSTGVFHELDAARELEMVQVNISALLGLSRALLPAMVARGSGRILNIASTAGFQPGPYMATYYATKAFVVSFSEALWFELRGTGVTVTASCPGATATEFSGLAGNDSSRLFAMGAASAEGVAREAWEAMKAGRSLVIHGLRNKLGYHALRVSPRAAARAVAANLNRPGQKALPGR